MTLNLTAISCQTLHLRSLFFQVQGHFMHKEPNFLGLFGTKHHLLWDPYICICILFWGVSRAYTMGLSLCWSNCSSFNLVQILCLFLISICIKKIYVINKTVWVIFILFRRNKELSAAPSPVIIYRISSYKTRGYYFLNCLLFKGHST